MDRSTRIRVWNGPLAKDLSSAPLQPLIIKPPKVTCVVSVIGRKH